MTSHCTVKMILLLLAIAVAQAAKSATPTTELPSKSIYLAIFQIYISLFCASLFLSYSYVLSIGGTLFEASLELGAKRIKEGAEGDGPMAK